MYIFNWAKIEATGTGHKLKQQGWVEQEVVKNKRFPNKENKHNHQTDKQPLQAY